MNKRSSDALGDHPAAKKQKKSSAARGPPHRLQGKWETTLGTLFVRGDRAFYGNNLTAHSTETASRMATKFMYNMTQSGDGKEIRGNWRWSVNDTTFGRFRITLNKMGTNFSGTWGWDRRVTGGGAWSGAWAEGQPTPEPNPHQTGNTPRSTEALTAIPQVQRTMQPTMASMAYQNYAQTLSSYAQQMNAYAMAGYSQYNALGQQAVMQQAQPQVSSYAQQMKAYAMAGYSQYNALGQQAVMQQAQQQVATDLQQAQSIHDAAGILADGSTSQDVVTESRTVPALSTDSKYLSGIQSSSAEVPLPPLSPVAPVVADSSRSLLPGTTENVSGLSSMVGSEEAPVPKEACPASIQPSEEKRETASSVEPPSTTV